MSRECDLTGVAYQSALAFLSSLAGANPWRGIKKIEVAWEEFLESAPDGNLQTQNNSCHLL